MLEYQLDQIKIGDFLLLAKFWACLLFFNHPLHVQVTELMLYFLAQTMPHWPTFSHLSTYCHDSRFLINLIFVVARHSKCQGYGKETRRLPNGSVHNPFEVNVPHYRAFVLELASLQLNDTMSGTKTSFDVVVVVSNFIQKRIFWCMYLLLILVPF